MIPIVYVHGWGFTAELWRPLQERLGGTALDLGNFQACPEGELPADRVLAIGHSLGFAWLLHHKPLRWRWRWRGLVSVNGFARFTAANDLPTGVASRILARMINRFAQEPATVHAEFLRHCGIDEPHSEGLNTVSLLQGLEALARWDERAALRAETVPVLALAGRRDRIVPAELTEATFASVTWQEDGGHVLPLSHPDWCAEHIRAFMAQTDG